MTTTTITATAKRYEPLLIALVYLFLLGGAALFFLGLLQERQWMTVTGAVLFFGHRLPAIPLAPWRGES